jgi:acetyltransferase-like isoleucine patch superfamily enzyme
MSDDRYRELKPLPDAEATFTRWIAHLDTEFTRHSRVELRGEIVRDELHQLYLGRPHGGKLNFNMVTELPFNVLQLTLDPRNATLEPEYYSDVDMEKYAVLKPLIWFWRMFDRSPVGLNQWLGFRFRAMLGRHIFQHIGKDVRIFHGVEFSFGYNLTIEDNCTIHKYASLDDRRPIILPAGSTILDYAKIDSNTRDIGNATHGGSRAGDDWVESPS